MSLKYTCPGCGTPLGYDGLCWKCKSEQDVYKRQLDGLQLHQNGETYPNDYFESLCYDFISRCDGDEWPE